MEETNLKGKMRFYCFKQKKANILPSDHTPGHQKRFAQSASLAQTTGVNLKYLIRAASGINYSAILHGTKREKRDGKRMKTPDLIIAVQFVHVTE
uniref:Basonuclin 2 n=1 Tax=Nothobranchius furzeri TaxID=105023 RepID=A0A1A8UUQ1_NOTFU